MKEENRKLAVDLRHRLHQCPELSMEEKETASILKSFLREHTDLEVVDRGAWFYAKKNGQPGAPRIAFRADMDALPIPESVSIPHASMREGVSHKCGHDGHCAALCGLAMELDGMEILPTVYLLFQPGEEIGSGAKICRQLIPEEGISEIYAFHNLGGYPENSIVYREGLTQPASEGLRLVFHGRTSHASAPEEGLNPANLLAELVLRTGELAEGEQDQLLLCTITGIRLGTGDFGISPGAGEICMTLRAEREDAMKALESQIVAFAEKKSREQGFAMEHSIHDYFPETGNRDVCLNRVRRAASALTLHSISMETMWRASEDFGHYTKLIPGAMFYIGNGVGYPPLHTAEYDFNDGILETAVNMFTEIVGDFGH